MYNYISFFRQYADLIHVIAVKLEAKLVKFASNKRI